MGEIVAYGQFPPPPPPKVFPYPRPRPPEIRRTNHGLQLALTIFIGIITLGVGFVVWPIVWLILHAVHESNNGKEQDRYAREMHWYSSAWQQYQDAYYAAYGRYPPEPLY